MFLISLFLSWISVPVCMSNPLIFLLCAYQSTKVSYYWTLFNRKWTEMAPVHCYNGEWDTSLFKMYWLRRSRMRFSVFMTDLHAFAQSKTCISSLSLLFKLSGTKSSAKPMWEWLNPTRFKSLQTLSEHVMVLIITLMRSSRTSFCVSDSHIPHPKQQNLSILEIK